MKLFVFGSSLTSSYWNGAATYYRGLYKHLSRLGYEITFAEPDIYARQQNRDFDCVDYARVVVYQTPAEIPELIDQATDADMVIKHSGVGAEDEVLEREVLRRRSHHTRVAFWDVDAPATLARVENNPLDPFRYLIPQYDYIFTYGGGPSVIRRYLKLGASNSNPIYNALDPETHHPVLPDPSLACDLAFVGHRLPDRERRVEEFFFRSAQLAPDLFFVLGGEGWGNRPLPSNVRWIGHVVSADHNRINSSAHMVLNINRESMAEVGFSPPTRIFEAAGAGACVITDHWLGVDQFFVPEKEILVAERAEQVVSWLRQLSAASAKEVGRRMLSRALRDHTYQLRAQQFDDIVRDQSLPRPGPACNREQTSFEPSVVSGG